MLNCFTYNHVVSGVLPLACNMNCKGNRAVETTQVSKPGPTLKCRMNLSTRAPNKTRPHTHVAKVNIDTTNAQEKGYPRGLICRNLDSNLKQLTTF